MQNEHDHFLKIEPERKTGDKQQITKWKQKRKRQKFKKQVWLLSTREIPSVQQAVTQQQTKKIINLSVQSLTEGQI